MFVASKLIQSSMVKYLLNNSGLLLKSNISIKKTLKI